MKPDTGRKTHQSHWDAAWGPPVRMRVPSRLNIDVRNFTQLLAPRLRPGMRYLEVGCAPGKLLAWVAQHTGVESWGLDYSSIGVQQCRALFDALGLNVRLTQDDFFANQLPGRSFDLVTSFGFIEHFDDPTEAVERHLELLTPGGTALISVPNYGSVYGRLQRRLDPENLALHNTTIMSPAALEALVKRPGFRVTAYHWGRASPWLVSVDRALPQALARGMQWMVNLAAHMQPGMIQAAAPTLVLEVTAEGRP